jgi:hypothetical protein
MAEVHMPVIKDYDSQHDDSDYNTDAAKSGILTVEVKKSAKAVMRGVMKQQ